MANPNKLPPRFIASEAAGDASRASLGAQAAIGAKDYALAARQLAEARSVARRRSAELMLEFGASPTASAWARLAEPSPPAASDFALAITDSEDEEILYMAEAIGVIARSSGNSAWATAATALMDYLAAIYGARAAPEAKGAWRVAYWQASLGDRPAELADTLRASDPAPAPAN